MPRDGSNIYHRPPGTDGIPNTTIASTAYNGYVADVEQDLNLPRPIVAGGTGANNAKDAMTSLQGDLAYQVVTNYDSYAFVSGSFYSAAGATSAPTVNAFIGHCYTSDPAVVPPAVPAGQNMFVEARDVTTGLKYVRQKTAGVWGAWAQQAGSTAVLDAAYVNVSGDTMTGNLLIQPAANDAVLALNKPTSTYQNLIMGQRAGANRWAIANGNSVAESTGNAGSDWSLLRYDDTGAFLGSPFSIVRSSGSASFSGILSVGGTLTANASITSAITATTGSYYFGNSGTKSLNYDGSNFNFSGAALVVNSNVYSILTATTGGYYFGSSGTKYLTYDGTNFNLAGGNLYTSNHVIQPAGTTLAGVAAALNIGSAGGGTQFGIALRPVVETATAVGLYNVAGAQVGTINTTSTTTFYNTSSDERLKEDLKTFDAGNIVDNTNVYDFAWKTTGKRSYGVIAQQAVEVYPAAVSYAKEQDWYGIDYSKYVPVLLQELKALRARVAQLEAKVNQ